MWSRIKGIYNYFFRVFLALSIILYMILVFFTLASKELSQNTYIVTFISLAAVLFSMPGIINTFVEEYNPKKTVYKLSCKCPNCKHLIQMDMKEE
ncbi:hypothetical protein HPT25_28020 [Bacillus sp. BRMEA1]|uniref:hypothetical protein n=1 Tax=Neobacillus endophyticus TaxID=2738405 RepID=UPI00156695A7|nr:hypothetical protein [Neobacillus endophyticus]NRD81142.1 hypothetical protein [Neobacillus endophyticus]